MSWFAKPPAWSGEHRAVLLSEEANDPVPPVKLEEILEKSAKFPRKFAVTTVCCSQLKQKASAKILEENINSVYPVLHEHALHLYASFLSYQKKYGNANFYKDMSLTQLVDRLLSKRAVAFLNPVDSYLLLDGTKGTGGWEKVGTSAEKPPLVLENCLSYDEIRLSALLSVSSHTYFINDGNRYNQGIPAQNLDEIEVTGVIIGLIGARLEKENVMEYRELVKSPRQNIASLGYGEQEVPTLQQKFLEFYGDRNATFNELKHELQSNKDRYVQLPDGTYFDKLMFERRIALSIDTLLIEADARAKKQNTTAYVHVVGIGLGVWKMCSEQNKIFTDTFANRLEFLKLPNVSDVCFAYIHQKTIGSCQDGGKISGITVHIRDRDPHLKLKGPHQGKLLVVSYAWDGNALPGNEFWFGSLSGSGDPAAACSTQIAELHNYHINRKVRGKNLMVATLEHGLVSFGEYQALHKDDSKL